MIMPSFIMVTHSITGAGIFTWSHHNNRCRSEGCFRFRWRDPRVVIFSLHARYHRQKVPFVLCSRISGTTTRTAVQDELPLLRLYDMIIDTYTARMTIALRTKLFWCFILYRIHRSQDRVAYLLRQLVREQSCARETD